jgi:twinkle protein
MGSERKGKAPDLEDTSGSKHFENMVDQGFSVHRPELFSGTTQRTETELCCRKARFEELGYPAKFLLNFDLSTRKYVPLHDSEFS